MNKEIALEIKKLNKSFLDENNEAEDILTNFNLQVEKNEFLCILGPSGCGKTTLLRCIAGFEKCQGEILVNGQQKTEPGIDRIMVFQDFNQLFPWKTVEKNIQYPLKQQGIKDKAVLDQLTSEYLEKVNLPGIQKKYPHQLSGGMKQRVAIAKALALKPQIILMDEPFAALDAMTRNKLLAEVQNISKTEDCTFMFITHNIQEAIVLGTRVMVMASGGKVKFDEKNTIEHPVTPASEGYGKLWKRLHDALEE
ncbi:MAG: ABC transporter ATP-binding protein [Lachnospiraceae bacterium]|nr:ABC transporter ATP-binding protein [Lachnospiraceae bacterium]